MYVRSPWGPLRLFSPIYRKSGVEDVSLHAVPENIRATILFNRMKSSKSVEIFNKDTTFNKALAIYRNVKKRLEKTPPNYKSCKSPAEIFHLKRRIKQQQVGFLNRLGFVIENKSQIQLKYPPEISILPDVLKTSQISDEFLFMPMNICEGIVSTNEWHNKGLFVNSLNSTIHPLYGVWSPTSQNYLEVLSSYLETADLNEKTCVEIGSGTGVISFLFAEKKSHVFCIDNNKQAVKCTNLNALKLGLKVACVEADVWKANLPECDFLVSNPPWIPASINSLMDSGVYDPDYNMLKGIFYESKILSKGGKLLLIYSDYAEKLGLVDSRFIERLGESHGLILKEVFKTPFLLTLDQRDPLKSIKDDSSIVLYEFIK